MKSSWCVSSTSSEPRIREASDQVVGDRRRAGRVALAEPERHGRADVAQVEPPRLREVAELVREPQAARAKRVDAAARVGLVGLRAAGGRHRLAPPPLDWHAGGCRRHAREPECIARVAAHPCEPVRRRQRRHGRNPRSRGRGRLPRPRVRAGRRPTSRRRRTRRREGAVAPLRPRPGGSDGARPGRCGRARSAGHRATRRSNRRGAVRDASPLPRAGRRRERRRDRRRRRSSARDDHGRLHPPRSMIGDGTPERVSPGRAASATGWRESRA